MLGRVRRRKVLSGQPEAALGRTLVQNGGARWLLPRPVPPRAFLAEAGHIEDADGFFRLSLSHAPADFRADALARLRILIL